MNYQNQNQLKSERNKMALIKSENLNFLYRMVRWHTVLTKISFFKARENLRCEIWMKMERKRILNQRIRRKNADFLECRDITLLCLSSRCFCFIHTLGTYVEDYLMLHVDKSSYTARSPPYTKFSCSIVLN